MAFFMYNRHSYPQSLSVLFFLYSQLLSSMMTKGLILQPNSSTNYFEQFFRLGLLFVCKLISNAEGFNSILTPSNLNDLKSVAQKQFIMKFMAISSQLNSSLTLYLIFLNSYKSAQYSSIKCLDMIDAPVKAILKTFFLTPGNVYQNLSSPSLQTIFLPQLDPNGPMLPTLLSSHWLYISVRFPQSIMASSSKLMNSCSYTHEGSRYRLSRLFLAVWMKYTFFCHLPLSMVIPSYSGVCSLFQIKQIELQMGHSIEAQWLRNDLKNVIAGYGLRSGLIRRRVIVHRAMFLGAGGMWQVFYRIGDEVQSEEFAVFVIDIIAMVIMRPSDEQFTLVIVIIAVGFSSML